MIEWFIKDGVWSGLVKQKFLIKGKMIYCHSKKKKFVQARPVNHLKALKSSESDRMYRTVLKILEISTCIRIPNQFKLAT